MSASNNKQLEIAKEFFLFNGHVLPSKEFDSQKTTIYPSFYEVIRIIDGVPLFFEEHINRLWGSIELLGYQQPYNNITIKGYIHKLLKTNSYYNYNVKIVVNELNAKEPNLFIYFVNSSYPTDVEYEKGVHSILYKAERDNPNAKVVATDFRDKVNTRMKDTNAYEALLVNNNGEVTEGSKSNMFFVKDDIFYTAPAKDVLVGITRTRIIQLCIQLGYKVIEGPVHVDFLEGIDGLFLTGTSPKVLPIATIDNHTYNSSINNAIKTVHSAYNQLIYDYIEQNKGSME